MNRKPDYIFLGVVLILTFCGLLFLASASSDISKIKYNDTYYFLKNQVLRGLIPGIIGFIAGFFIYYRKLKKIAPILFIINVILLILVFTPLGQEINGSHRWVDLKFFSFQPSELLKITFILYLASVFSSASVKNIKGNWSTYWIFMGVSALVGVLIFIQPATTMAVVIIGSGSLMYFFGRSSLKQIVITAVFGLVVIVGMAFVTPYRFSRVLPFWNTIVKKINPEFIVENKKVDSFHLEQSVTSIGSGGISGVGFGKSTSKFSVLPEAPGDSIFAVIGEELGFVGSLFVISLFVILFWRGTKIVLKSHDDFAKLTVLGFVSIISIQAIIHIGANSGILPFTGIPLPFISYGGTSLMVTLTMAGIIGNISKSSNI